MSHILSNKLRKYRKYVTKASDLAGTLSSDALYFIDGNIDMGTQEIEVPIGGLAIAGDGFGVSGLYSTENNYTMFKNAVAADAGDLFILGLEFETSGTSSQVFDLDNNGNSNAVEMNVVNFNNCTSIGELDNYRQFLATNLGIFGCADGLTFTGVWAGGARIDTAIVRSFGSSGTVIKAGTGLTFGSRFNTNINMQIPVGAGGIDLAPSNIINDGDFQIIGAKFSGGGDYLPNIDGSDLKARITNTTFTTNTSGKRNTYVGGQWSITGALTTTVASDNTLYKLAGTTTYSDLQWFTGAASNAFVFASELTTEVEVKGLVALTSTNNNVLGVTIRHWDDSASAYVDLSSSAVTANGAGRAEGISLLAYAVLDQNDRIEVWVENQTGANDIVGVAGGLFTVRER